MEYKKLIYQVRNPLTEKLIYVGKTEDLGLRIYQHFITPHSMLFHQEIISILSKGHWPEFEILDIVPRLHSQRREACWVYNVSKLYPLHNIDDRRTEDPKKLLWETKLRKNLKQHVDRLRSYLPKHVTEFRYENNKRGGIMGYTRILGREILSAYLLKKEREDKDKEFTDWLNS